MREKRASRVADATFTFEMSGALSRRNFLRGRFAVRAPALRPPWAVAEADFARLCSRCGDCSAACPTRIIVPGDGGYPTVNFSRGECSFCAACVAACPSGALRRQAEQSPWSLRAAIGESCLARRRVECRVCGDLCPVAAIRFLPQRGGPSLPLLDAARCTGCGACVAPCPVRVIVVAEGADVC